MAITIESLLIKIDGDLSSLNSKLDQATQKSVATTGSIAASFTRLGERVAKEMVRMGKFIVKWTTIASASLIAMGKVGAEAGRGLSAGGDYAAAAFDNLQLILVNSSKAVSEGLAPAFQFLADKIEVGIDKMGGMAGITQKVQEVSRVAIKVIGDGWQGMTVIFNGVRAGLKSMEVSWLVLKDKFSTGLDFIGASFAATGTLISLGWHRVVAGLATVFRDGTTAIADTMISLSQSMMKAGVKGGSELYGLALDMRGAVQGLGAGAVTELRNAERNLDQRIAAMETARGALINGTEEGNAAIAQARRELAEIRGEIAKTTDSIANSGTLGTILQQEFDAVVASDKRTFTARVEFLTALQKMRQDFAKEEKAWNDAKLLGDTQYELIRGHEVLRLQSDFYSERQKMRLERDTDIVLAEERLSQEILRVQHKRYQDERNAQLQTTALWQSGADGKMEVMGNFFKTLTPLMEAQSRKQFEIGKAAAIAETIVNTYSAAMGAFKSLSGIPIVGYALGAAAAAAVVATGLMNIQRIRSTKFGGGGGVSPVRAASPSSLGGGSQAQSAGQGPQRGSITNVNVTLVGERQSTQSVRDLMGVIREQTGDNVRIRTRTA